MNRFRNRCGTRIRIICRLETALNFAPETRWFLPRHYGSAQQKKEKARARRLHKDAESSSRLPGGAECAYFQAQRLIGSSQRSDTANRLPEVSVNIAVPRRPDFLDQSCSTFWWQAPKPDHNHCVGKRHLYRLSHFAYTSHRP